MDFSKFYAKTKKEIKKKKSKGSNQIKASYVLQECQHQYINPKHIYLPRWLMKS